MARKQAPKLLYLLNGRFMPGAEAFHCKWQENNSLLVAGLPGLVHLSLVSNRQGMARGLGSLVNKGCLQRIDHSDIQGSIFTTRMPGDKDIGWFTSLPRNQVLPFLSWTKGSVDCCAVEGVPEGVVSSNPLTLPGTVESVIPKAVARPAACWTGPVRTKNKLLS